MTKPHPAPRKSALWLFNQFWWMPSFAHGLIISLATCSMAAGCVILFLPKINCSQNPSDEHVSDKPGVYVRSSTRDDVCACVVLYVFYIYIYINYHVLICCVSRISLKKQQPSIESIITAHKNLNITHTDAFVEVVWGLTSSYQSQVFHHVAVHPAVATSMGQAFRRCGMCWLGQHKGVCLKIPGDTRVP